MGTYMASKGIDKGKDVCRFKLVNVDFNWQGDGYSHNDCGVYMLLHMLLYCGFKFDCDLGSKARNNLFRFEIAATLVLSDINQSRSDILEKVEKFNASKQILFTTPEAPKSRNKTIRIPKSASRRKNKVVCDEPLAKRPCTDETQSIYQSGTIVPLKKSTPASVLLSPLKSRRIGGGDGLGCTLDCGQITPDLLVVSYFLRQNQGLVKELPDLRKNVADFCFLNDYGMNSRDTVAKYDKYTYLCREDIYSMDPTVHTYETVIECWSKLLNSLEFEDDAALHRAFLGIRHTDAVMRILGDEDEVLTQSYTQYNNLFAYWDTFTKKHGREFFTQTDLLFVPFNLENHYFCICINFPKHTVDVLDYYNHPDFKGSRVHKAALTLAGCLSDYFASKEPTRDFPMNLRFIKFIWQSRNPNDEESGTITMMHMLMYEGNSFSHPDMRTKVNRRFLIINSAAVLILADINLHRSNTLKDVENFVAIKDQILKKVKASRKRK